MAKWLLTIGLVATGALACSWDYPIWIQRSKSADALYRFEKGEKAGFIDRSGKIVIPPVVKLGMNGDNEFREGVLFADSGYVDVTGKRLIELQHMILGSFSEGLAAARRETEQLWGYVDRSGKFAISPRFHMSATESVSAFADDRARIEVDGKNGYIDHSGQFVIAPQFAYADDFSDGIARVVDEGNCVYFFDSPCDKGDNPPTCKFSFIDKNGHFITQDRFDFARKFSEGLAPVQKDKRWGFLDKTGRLAIAFHYEDAQPFSNGLARVKQNGSYGYIDKQGKLVIPPWFEFAEDFAGGLAPVGNADEGYWYIDKTGQEALPHRYAIASPFFKGLAHVQLLDENEEPSDTFAYIDTTGRHVFEYQR
jgi:hypothetical protein